MSRAQPLPPTGAVSELDPRGVQLPAPLLRALRDGLLSESALQRAFELARCSGEEESGARSLWLWLLAAALTARERGSTRFALRGEGGLAPILEELGAEGDTIEEALALLCAAQPSVHPLVGVFGDFKPLLCGPGSAKGSTSANEGDPWYCWQRDQLLEARIARALAARAAGTGWAAPAQKLSPGERALLAPLSDEQRRAVLLAMEAPLALISGGPGTGKTTIIATLLRLLAGRALPAQAIAIAAPTGRAAHRLAESLSQALARAADAARLTEAELALRTIEPKTLHSLLGLRPELGRSRSATKSAPRLGAQVVIVDECSMLDLPLFDALLSSLAQGSRLILLGDAKQLPSIDAGALFRDLCASPSLAPLQLTLTKPFRTSAAAEAGRALQRAASAIEAGDTEALLSRDAPGEAPTLTRRALAAELTFEGVELLSCEASAAREQLFDRWFEERTCGGAALAPLLRAPIALTPEHGAERAEPREEERLTRLFERLGSGRILCATREESRGSGAAALNAAMHQRALARGAASRSVTFGQTSDLQPGEPIMVLRNDPHLGVANGDQGLVMRVSRPGAGNGAREELAALFAQSGGYRAIPLRALEGRLQLSYAMTVHKAQGSEYESVAIVLPDEPIALFTRELLYTALTRAKRGALFVYGLGYGLGRPTGQPRPSAEALIARAVEAATIRHSGLSDALELALRA